MDPRTIYRHVTAVGRRAGVGHVHPHALRHTLATQCINRGMSLEAIAALLGHRSPRMTLVYARISDTTVAEQYFTATAPLEAGSDAATARPDHDAVANAAAPPTAPRQRSLHPTPSSSTAKWNPPAKYYPATTSTAIEFRPTLQRQRNHAQEHGQPEAPPCGKPPAAEPQHP